MEDNIIENTQQIFTVSRLNNTARLLLEDHFSAIWVEGEISNFSAPSSGHWYFSLKDASAQIRCALFRGAQRQLGFQPKDGMQVLARGRISLYEPRGEYQLIADFLEERGEGKLRRAFEQLKKKLAAEGLFAADHKIAIPPIPKSIGVITSPTGAAIRDIIHVLNRRAKHIPIIIYPTMVQGDAAAPAIAKAIEIANERNECDVLILARGGGSLEDLWPFNEEIVARAVYASNLPIVTGVGHEVDFTIVDFIADLRAPTPSAAAEIVTKEVAGLTTTLTQHENNLKRYLSILLTRLQSELKQLEKHLFSQHPKKRLEKQMQTLDLYQITLSEKINRITKQQTTAINQLAHQLLRQNPQHRIHDDQTLIQKALQKIESQFTQRTHALQTQLANAAGKLDSLSPLATLHRGYAIAYDQSGNMLRDTAHLNAGDDITIRLAKEELACKINAIKELL